MLSTSRRWETHGGCPPPVPNFLSEWHDQLPLGKVQLVMQAPDHPTEGKGNIVLDKGGWHATFWVAPGLEDLQEMPPLV